MEVKIEAKHVVSIESRDAVPRVFRLVGAGDGGGMQLRRLKFRDGRAIDLHQIRNGEQCYREWPKGVESQSIFGGLRRMPIDAFTRAVEELREEEKREAMEAAR